MLLYAYKQILPVEAAAKALWDQRVGKTSELTDFTHQDGGTKDTTSNWNLDLLFFLVRWDLVETRCATKKDPFLQEKKPRWQLPLRNTVFKYFR